MSAGFVDRVRHMASGLHRACYRADADDLVQDALVGDLTGPGGSDALRLTVAYRTMANKCRHERWMAARVDDGAAEPVDQRTPEDAMARAEVVRIIRERLAAHLEAHPELITAARVLAGNTKTRHTADAVATYRATKRLRERLAADVRLQAVWADVIGC